MPQMSACGVSADVGQDVSILVDDITNQNVRKQGNIGRLKVLQVLLSAVLCSEEAAEEEMSCKDSKTLLTIAGIIMAANCTAITSLPSSHENRDEGFRQAALIPANLSLMTTLFIMAAKLGMPTFNLGRAKKLVDLAMIFTVCSYTAFVAIKLGSSSHGIVAAIIFTAIYMIFIALVFLSHKFRIKTL